MNDREALSQHESNWLNSEYGNDIYCAGRIECDIECDLCGEMSPESKTIRYSGKTICFCCVEIILEKYRMGR